MVQCLEVMYGWIETWLNLKEYDLWKNTLTFDSRTWPLKEHIDLWLTNMTFKKTILTIDSKIWPLKVHADHWLKNMTFERTHWPLTQRLTFSRVLGWMVTNRNTTYNVVITLLNNTYLVLDISKHLHFVICHSLLG